jgi:hypothetical protein
VGQLRYDIGARLAYAHICTGSDKGVCDRVDEFPRHTKVADLDLSLSVGQDI